MMVVKVIQEVWWCFNKRYILYFSKLLVKKVRVEDGNIFYYILQQVCFQYLEENCFLFLFVMVNKEIQFFFYDNLVFCRFQLFFFLKFLVVQGILEFCVQVFYVVGVWGVVFLLYQMVIIRFFCLVSLDVKCQLCLLIRIIRSICFVYIEGDLVKIKCVIVWINKVGVLEILLFRRYDKEVMGLFRV